jgi:hypothetical protein
MGILLNKMMFPQSLSHLVRFLEKKMAAMVEFTMDKRKRARRDQFKLVCSPVSPRCEYERETVRMHADPLIDRYKET